MKKTEKIEKYFVVGNHESVTEALNNYEWDLFDSEAEAVKRGKIDLKSDGITGFRAAKVTLEVESELTPIIKNGSVIDWGLDD